MSELINPRSQHREARVELLASVSALALLSVLYEPGTLSAAEENGGSPTVWIELGGQLSALSSHEEAFSPPFMASVTQPNLLSALDVQRPLGYSIDGEGKISFLPDDSNWVFSASVQYGRSSASRHRHQQTANAVIPVHVSLYGKYLPPKYYYPTLHAKFADGIAELRETHAVVDFQAGKDIGVGLFGGHASSVLSAGIRIAQFTSQSHVTLRAEPDVHYPSTAIMSYPQLRAFKTSKIHFHDFAATIDARRNFRGIGPSLAWNNSLPFLGNASAGELSLDLGLNGAVLVGRQRSSAHRRAVVQSYYEVSWKKGQSQKDSSPLHPTPGHFENVAAQHYYDTGGATAHHTSTANPDRSRTVVVPNFGAIAGLSFRYANAKLSFGYRADFFFGAMDGGIDIARKENTGFYGPFASISVGLGG